MAGLHKAKKSKKQRKNGRNAVFCDIYRRAMRAEHSKLRTVRKHVVRHPGDAVAVATIERLNNVIRGC